MPTGAADAEIPMTPPARNLRMRPGCGRRASEVVIPLTDPTSGPRGSRKVWGMVGEGGYVTRRALVSHSSSETLM